MKETNQVLALKNKIKLLEKQILNLMEGNIDLCDLDNLRSIIIKNTLTSSEKQVFDLIKTGNEQNPISIDQISSQIYSFRGSDIQRRVFTHISKLNSKIRDSGRIINVYGKGYYFKEKTIKP